MPKDRTTNRKYEGGGGGCAGNQIGQELTVTAGQVAGVHVEGMPVQGAGDA